MSTVYYVTDKGRRTEPANPEGKAVMDYCKEHSPVNADEVKLMVPQSPNPQVVLESLANAGFLSKDTEGGSNVLNWMTSGR